MAESLPCAVCGRPVYMDEDHSRVSLTRKRINDRDEKKEFYLHDDCEMNVFGGWREP